MADRPTDQQWHEQVISIDRVARVVRGGRRFRFRALVTVGDGKRQVGIGIAKGDDVQSAITKAVATAKKQLVQVPLDKGTIPHEITIKYGGAHVMLKPAAPGTGVIAGGVVRTIIDATGIENILSKSLGSNNKINNAYATIEAFTSLVPKKDWLHPPIKTTKPVKAKAKPVVKTKQAAAKAGSKS
ncbi:MAG TPA: 30S ribosomal protein S5 [Candidatus Saccharimonadales bacterium]